MKRHTDRKQTQWQGQMHYVLFHSWLNPPFIFSRLSHLAPHQFYDLFYVLCPQTPISLLKHPPLILIPLAASTLSFRLSLPLFLPFLFPSSLPSLSPPPRCAPDSLSFPSLTHSGSILPSPLLPSHSPLHASLSAPLATFLFPSPTNTYHPSHLPRLLPISLSSISSHSSLLLTHSLNLAVLPNAHVHTHADWHPRTEHPLPKTGFQAVRSRGQHASWHWAQLRKRTRKRPWSTATSLFFPQTGAPGAQGRIPLKLPRDALSDHYPSSIIVSCSVLAYQVRDVHMSVFFHLHALFCVNLLTFFDDSLALVACSVASWFVVHLPAGLSECVVHSCSRVSLHAHILLIHQPDLVANTCGCTCTKHVCVCACVHLEFLMLLPLTWKDSGIIGSDILISEITLFQYFPDIWSQTKRWHLFY